MCVSVREGEMVRVWKEMEIRDGSGFEGQISAVCILWVALLTLTLISAIIFSCGDGVSKDKASATHTDAYTDSYTAGCGAG